MDLNIKVFDKRIAEPEYYPKYAREGDHGVDLRACIDDPILLRPGDTCKIGVGWAVDLSSGGGGEDWSLGGFVIPKSGSGSAGLVVGNLVGLIDEGYHGQIAVTAWNRGGYVTGECGRGWEIGPITIHPMQRFAQLVFLPVAHPEKFIMVSDFGHVTDRGEGGHGSTGVD